MATVRVSREDITLRFGDADTPAPEGDVAAQPARIVVAVSPAGLRIRVSLVIGVEEPPRVLALQPVRRVATEQFFEGTFPIVQRGEAVEYTVRADVEREGQTLRLNSAEVRGGRRRFVATGDGPRPRPAPPMPPGTVIGEVVTTPPGTVIGEVVTTLPGTVVGEVVSPTSGVRIPGGRVPEIDVITGGGGPLPGGPGGRLPGGPGGADPVEALPARSFKVSGSLLLEHGQPAAKVQLKVYRRDFGGGKTYLKEAPTDENGRYEISYTMRGVPNIELYAVAADGTEVPVSRTKFGAGSDEKLNLVAPSKVRPPEPEFTRLTRAVSPLLQKKPETLKTAVERGDRRDISALAAATGWDGRALALASSAFQNADVTKVPADALYALYRAGFPTDVKTLARVDRGAVQKALTQAGQAGIIDAATADAGAKAFDSFASVERLKFVPPGKLAGLSDFAARLPAMGVVGTDAEAFTNALKADHGKDLWVRAKAAGVSDQAIAKLKLQGKLAYLTLNNIELTTQLQPKLGKGDPRQLIDLDFDQAATWAGEISRLAAGDDARLGKLIPPAFEGRTNQERLAAYSDELARRVRHMDPNLVTTRQLARGDLDGLDAGARVRVGSFLATAAPKGFRLGQTAMSAFVKQEGGEAALLPGMNPAQRKAALEDVRTLHRLYSVSPSDKALNVLLKEGFKSAFDIVAVPYDHFVKVVGPKIGSTRETQQLYWKAQEQSATIINVFSGAKQLGATSPLESTTGGQKKRDGHLASAIEKLRGRYPTLESLFGGVDYCECDHCNSVLSPAAYLVDILHFIDPRDVQWKFQKSLWAMAQGDPAKDYEDDHLKPFDALVARRPDIPHIPLTCENTNTALPYIDIVIEILERIVAQGTPGTASFDTGAATSEDLLAEPQNITWEAYVGGNGKAGLKDFVYPGVLPFDLPLEVAREFLRRLELPLWKLRETVGRPSKLVSTQGKADGLTDVWFERLGLGPADVKVLAGGHDWHALFGYEAEETALKELVRAKNLARRLGVNYQELVELMKTSFVNPVLDNLVVLRRLEIDPHDLDRYLNPPAQNPLTSAERSAFEARLQARGLVANDLAPLWGDAVRERVLELHSPEKGCDFSETTLEFEKPPADTKIPLATALFRMLVFVRLRRILGWTTRELDGALRVFIRPDVAALTLNSGETMRTALMYLSHLKVISELAGGRVSLEELLILWAPIPTAGTSSMYERLFLNPGVLALDSMIFDNKLGRYFDGLDADVADHVDAVRQALQISHEEIDQIFAYVGTKDAKLSIDNLSSLMRYKVLARALDLSVPDLLIFLSLSTKVTGALKGLKNTAQNLDDDVPFSETIAFMREVELVREAGLTPETLEAICRHRGSVVAAADPSAIVERTLLALSALPRPEPLVAGADAVATKQFEAEKQRERLAVVQTLSSQIGASEPLITMLVTKVLTDAVSGKPIIEESLGLRASSLPLDGATAQRYVWFAAAGTYKFTTKPELNAKLKFGLGDDVSPVTAAAGVFVLPDARVGERYRLELTFPAPGAIVTEGDAAPTSILVSDYARFANDIARLRKAVDMLEALGATALELEHVGSLPGALSLNDLPLAPVNDDQLASARTTFAALVPWIDVAAARRRHASGDRIVGVLRAAKRTYGQAGQETAFDTDLNAALSALTGWTVPFIESTRKALGYTTQTTQSAGAFVITVPGLTSGEVLREFTNGAAALIRLGSKPADIVGWATLPIDKSVATAIRAAVKGRHGPAAWRRLAQPVFDGLRKKQRDALVAHLTHLTGRPYGETQEQLFEHLLFDPGTEPPVLASRIQLATNSVQLFVQRCLMNFEEKVAPSIIDASRWAWMSRYRIWEVNRKFFVWPENWLDPEFRDDKTHLFRDLEGALLQGDVSDDLVRTALYTYLQGLESIARLEMMTMYFEAGASPDSSTVHVIGRTPSAPYKYFYRKCSHGSWTPWEPLDVEIDGEHVALTVWRGRMHLFWVTFMDKAQETAPSTKTIKTLADETAVSLAAKRQVQLQLNWVEQVEGKWTNRSSTQEFLDAANFLGERASDPETRSEFFLHVNIDAGETPRVGDDILKLHITKGTKVPQSFVLFSKLAPPRLENEGHQPNGGLIDDVHPRATKWRGDGALAVKFKSRSTQKDGGDAKTQEGTYNILEQGTEYRLLFPSNDIRLSADTTIPRASGEVTGYLFAPQGARHVVYRGADTNVHDVWSTPNGWFHTNASATARGGPATGDPHGYPLDEQYVNCVAYASERTLVELSWSQLDALGPDSDGESDASWRAEILYEADSDAVRPVGRPFGGVFAPKRGVVFRTADKVLRGFVEGASTGTWQPVAFGQVLAASDPTGLVMSVTIGGVKSVQSRHVFFRGTDNHIHELRSDAAGAQWIDTDLTTLTEAPAPAADANPKAYAFLEKRTANLVYRGQDGFVHLLSGAAGVWKHDAIGAKSGAAVGDPVGYVTEFSGTQHVVYRGKDNKIHELWGTAQGWKHIVASEKPGAVPVPAGDPTGYSFERQGSHHIVYRDADGRLSELSWELDRWQLGSFRLFAPPLDEIGPLITPFFYEDVKAPHTFFVEPSLAEKTVHDWEEYVVTTEEYVELKVPVAIEVIPWFPEKVDIKLSDLAVVEIPRGDRLFADDVVLATDKGVFGAVGGVGPKILEGATLLEGGPVVRVFDTRRGVTTVRTDGLVTRTARRGGTP